MVGRYSDTSTSSTNVRNGPRLSQLSSGVPGHSSLKFILTQKVLYRRSLSLKHPSTSSLLPPLTHLITYSPLASSL